MKNIKLKTSTDDYVALSSIKRVIIDDVQRRLDLLPDPDFDKYTQEEVDQKISSIPLEEYATLFALDNAVASLDKSIDSKADKKEIVAAQKSLLKQITSTEKSIKKEIDNIFIPSVANLVSEDDLGDAIRKLKRQITNQIEDSIADKNFSKTVTSSVVRRFSKISDLKDVDLDNLQDDDLLQYNSSTGKWENVPATSIASPAGNNGELQYNDNGSFGAIGDSFYNSTTGLLGLGTDSPTAKINTNFTGNPDFSSLPNNELLMSSNEVNFTGDETEQINLTLQRNSADASYTSVSNNFATINGVENNFTINYDTFTSAQNSVQYFFRGLRANYNYRGAMDQVFSSFGFNESIGIQSSVRDSITTDGVVGNVYAHQVAGSEVGVTLSGAESSGLFFRYVTGSLVLTNISNVSGDFFHTALNLELRSASSGFSSNFVSEMIKITNANTNTSNNFSILSDRGTAQFTTGASGIKGLVVKGTSTQTANLQEWQNSSSVVLSAVDGDGNIGAGTSSPSQLLDVNDDTIRVRNSKTPASGTATGTQGQVAWDDDYIYVCIATNSWKRASLNPFTGPSGRTDGIADYNDTATASTPINLVANTWTTLTNNGAGAFTNTSYLPEGVTNLMDTSTGQFDFSELALGDYVIIRNDYTVTPNTNNALLELRYQLGNGGGAYTLQKTVGRLDSGSGIGYTFALTPDFIYMGDANTRDNPVTLQIRLSTSGTVVNAGSAIGVNKR